MQNNDYIHPNQSGSEQRKFVPIYLSTSALNPLIRFRIMQIQRREPQRPQQAHVGETHGARYL